MIASVRGEVTVRRADHVVIECCGVGYRLAVSAHTLRTVPKAGEEALLHTHLVVRDDGMQLYGFASEEERELFLMLVGVQSVGPKVALAVLSGGSPRELTMRPTSRVDVEEGQVGSLMRLIEALEEHDDVNAVHANFNVDGAVLERVAAA